MQVSNPSEIDAMANFAVSSVNCSRWTMPEEGVFDSRPITDRKFPWFNDEQYITRTPAAIASSAKRCPSFRRMETSHKYIKPEDRSPVQNKQHAEFVERLNKNTL